MDYSNLTEFEGFFDRWKYNRYTRAYTERGYRDNLDRPTEANIVLWSIAKSIDVDEDCILTSSDLTRDERRNGGFYANKVIRKKGISFILSGTYTSALTSILIASSGEVIGNPPAAVCTLINKKALQMEKKENEMKEQEKEEKKLKGIMEGLIDESGL